MTRRAGKTVFLLTGVAGGVAGAAAMMIWLIFCAEVANEPTAVPGIQSSAWTPVTAITSFLFGIDAFHGSFAVLSILFGLAAHLFLGIVFGLVGVALLSYTFAGRPTPAGAALFGFVYGLTLQVLVLNVIVNWMQDVHTVADALPSWGWWIAHAFYGTTLGIVAARMLSVGTPGVTPQGRLASEAAP